MFKPSSLLPGLKSFISGMPHNLTRITSGSRFIPEIDGLRFLAIVPVVLMHFCERLARASKSPLTENDKLITAVFSNGHIGVYLFFAISGFILSLPFGISRLNHQPPVSLSKYYLRRVTRLEPPYIIIMTLLFVSLIVVMHQPFQLLAPHFAASLLYLHRIIYGVWSPINPPAWTLEIEVQFYIVAPFLAILYFSAKRIWVRRGLLIGLVLLKIFVDNLTTMLDPAFLTLPYAIQFFMVGILAADIYLVDWKQGVSHKRLYDLVCIACLVLVFSTWTWGKDLSWKFIFIVSLFVLFTGSFRAVYVNRFLRNGWVTAIGGMCYTIYLLHLPCAELFAMVYQRFSPDFPFTAKLIIGLALFLPLLFAVSCLFFLFIEKPCMDPNWPRKLKAFLITATAKSKVT